MELLRILENRSLDARKCQVPNSEGTSGVNDVDYYTKQAAAYQEQLAKQEKERQDQIAKENEISQQDRMKSHMANAQNFMGRNRHMGRREARRWAKSTGMQLSDAAIQAYRDFFNSGSDDMSKIWEHFGKLDTKSAAQHQQEQENAKRETWYRQNYVNQLRSNAEKKFKGKFSDQAGLQKFLYDYFTTKGVVPDGVNLNLVKGKWGSNSQGAYDAYLDLLKDPYERKAFQDATDGIQFTVYDKAGAEYRVNEFNRGEDAKGFEDFAQEGYAKLSNPTDIDDVKGNDYDADLQKKAKEDQAKKAQEKTNNEWKGVVYNPTYKQGGSLRRKVNYFQAGGAVAPQATTQPDSSQDIQAQVVQLVQAAIQGDKKATQTVEQIMQAAKQGDKQAMQIAQLIQAVVQQMQGQAQAAKRGAKLSYIHALKTGCPEGYEVSYNKKGGRFCKECVKKHANGNTLTDEDKKMGRGTKEQADTIAKNLSKRFPNLTKDQLAGRSPIIKDGKKYFMNGDGQLIDASKLAPKNFFGGKLYLNYK